MLDVKWYAFWAGFCLPSKVTTKAMLGSGDLRFMYMIGYRKTILKHARNEINQQQTNLIRC